MDIGWEIDGFVLADGFDQESGCYTGLVVPQGGASFGQITDSTLLVHPEAATAQSPWGRASAAGSPRTMGPALPLSCVPSAGVQPTTGRVHRAKPDPVVPTPTPPRGTLASTASTASTPSGTGAISAASGREILAHLGAMDGVDLDITVEVHAKHPDGFPDDKVRILLENASALSSSPSGSRTERGVAQSPPPAPQYFW